MGVAQRACVQLSRANRRASALARALLLIVLFGCADDAPPELASAQLANVVFPKEKATLYTVLEKDGSVRFRFCLDSVAYKDCPDLSDCTYQPDDLSAEVKKVKDDELRKAFSDMLRISFPTQQKTEAFLEPLCQLLARVRKEEKCKPKNACKPYVEKK
jgi:hypothetical protein